MHIPLSIDVSESKRTCFIVYSSREPHIEIAIDSIESVLESKGKYEVKRLATDGISGHSQYSQLMEYLNKCALAVIILDGLRPNVILEYGILIGLNKPCIVLLEENANIDICSLLKNNDETAHVAKIDIDKDISDIKDQMYVKYKYNKPKEFRLLLEGELTKIDKDVEETFIKMVFPEKDIIEQEVMDSVQIFSELSKGKTKPTEDDIVKFRVCVTQIEKAATKHNISLTDRYYYQKVGLLNKFGKYPESLTVLDGMAVEDDIDYLLSRYEVLRKMGDYDGAVSCINHAIQLDNCNELLWHQKALLLEAMKKSEEAIICYKKGISCNDGCASIHYHYGMLLLGHDKDAEALEQFELAISIRPTESRYLVCKAICLKELHKHQEAISLLHEALSYDENNAHAWYQLGLLSESDNDSLKYFEKCLIIDPTHTGALCSKGASLSNLGFFDDACHFLNKAVSNCKTSGGNGCSLLHANLGKTKYQQFMSGKPEYKNFLKESKHHYELALEMADDQEDIEEFTNNLGFICLNDNDISNAKIHLNKSISLSENNIKQLALSYYNLALCFLVENEIITASELLNKALNISKNFDESDNLCYCLLLPRLANDKVQLNMIFPGPNLNDNLLATLEFVEKLCIKETDSLGAEQK